MREDTMASEVPGKDPRALWQSQPVTGNRIMLDDIRRKARDLDRKARARNLAMAVSGVVNIGAMLAIIWFLPPYRLVAAIVLATAVYIVYQFVRRRPTRIPPDSLASMTGVEGYRASLTHHRDFVRTIFSWFLVPAVVGQLALMVGFIVVPPEVPRRVMLMVLPVWLLIDAGIFWFAWKKHQREAERIRAELEALDTLRRT
jgi:transposase InsO family protein